MTCGQVHPKATLKAAWWTWCCPECHPAVHSMLIRPERSGSSARCPFCLQIRAFTIDGLYRKHDDIGEKCRASGLPRSVALLVFQGIVESRDVTWLTDSIESGREARPFPGEDRVGRRGIPEVESWEIMIAALVQFRRERELAADRLAYALEVTSAAFRAYEELKVCPRLDLAIRWMAVFDMHLVFCDESDRVIIQEWRDVRSLLAKARRNKNLTSVQVGERTTSGPGVVWNRETTGAAENMRLRETITWAAALDFSTEME